MKFLLSYTRTMFWTIGVITILVALSIMVSAVGHLATRPFFAVFEFCFGLVPIGVGIGTCFAARALKRQGPFARTLVGIASVYSLVIFPFGTVAGAFGLYWCFSAKVRSLEPPVEQFEFQSRTGDGTSKWVQRVVSVASIVILLGSLAVARWWGEKHGLPSDAAVNGIVLLFLCEWITAFFHELGHAVAGRMVGMSLIAFSVGPFMGRKKSGRWKFGFTLVSFLGLGGSAATAPLHLRDLRRRMAVEIAAGPIASLLTAMIAMVVLSMMPGSSWVMWWKIPAVVAAMSAGAVVINLIPFGSAAGYSDGALLVQLLLGGPFADMREAVKTVGTTMATATRPREVDPATMSRGATAAVGGPEALHLVMIQLICAVDRGDLAVARACLESVLEAVPTAERANDPGIAAEIGFYIAYLDGHAGRASQWLRDAVTLAAKKKANLAGDFDYWLAATAVRLAEGREVEAEEAYLHAKELADRRPKLGLYEYERELIATVKEGGWIRQPEAALSTSA